MLRSLVGSEMCIRDSFTTRPDTLFGFSFLALSVDHEISKHFAEDKKFQEFKKECSKTGTTEEAIAVGDKIGFKTESISAIWCWPSASKVTSTSPSIFFASLKIVFIAPPYPKFL